MEKHKLVVIAGPTGIGKTAMAIPIANHFTTEIISADSRQIYREMRIGTACPDETQLNAVKHHLVGHVSIHQPYNAGIFEAEALAISDQLFKDKKIVFLVGGSGLFIDAMINGLDTFPEVDETIREQIRKDYQKKGIGWLQQEVKSLDPHYFQEADILNPQRLLRALEVSLTAGMPYSSFRTGNKKKRNFEVIKILINEPREQLYKKINERTAVMMKNSWMEEAESLFAFRHLNALNTVGYKELFSVIEGKLSLSEATEKIRQNTRRYAKRQITWFNNDSGYTEFNPNNVMQVISFIELVTQH